MSERKNYGTLLLLSSLVLGVFLLTGSFIWMQDKANMILAVFVLILYGIGQWMTVVYWQRIQEDWESTGEVLGRLQQAVSDIPAALDSNLKSIATRLTEGQAQALGKLQNEVNEGARLTLEKGSALIGESLAKNLQAPLASMNGMLSSFAEKSAAQSDSLRSLTESVRDDSRAAVAKGADLIAGSLDKNLRAPLASLETALAAWQQQASAQAEAARSFGQELRQAQREWSEKAEKMAEELSAEFRDLAGAGARSGEAAQAAWAARAAEVQAAWEERMQGLQTSLMEAVGREGARLGASLSDSAEALLARVEGLQGSQTQAQSAILEEALAGFAGQGESMREAASTFEDGLRRMREASLKLVEDMEAKAAVGHDKLAETLAQGQSRLVEEVSGLQRQVLGEAGKTLEAQGQIALEVAGKVSELADQLQQGSRGLQELAHVSQINQTEMQAGVAMLNAGLTSILERLEKQADAGDGYQSLLGDLGRTLASFQERSAEVLVENALKTQEILMEVLLQQERRGEQPSDGGPGGSGSALAAPEQALA